MKVKRLFFLVMLGLATCCFIYPVFGYHDCVVMQEKSEVCSRYDKVYSVFHPKLTIRYFVIDSTPPGGEDSDSTYTIITAYEALHGSNRVVAANVLEDEIEGKLVEDFFPRLKKRLSKLKHKELAKKLFRQKSYEK